MLNVRQSPIEDDEIEDYLINKTINFRATLDKVDAYIGPDYVVIAPLPTRTPTLTPITSTPSPSNLW